MPIFRTQAVVLRAYDFQEANRVLVLFTREHGKVRAVVKGVRKPGSKLAAGLSLFTHADLALHGLDHQDLWLVTQAQPRRVHQRLKANLEALGRAARLVEILNGLTPDRQTAFEVFDLLISALALFDQPVVPAAAGAWAEVNLLARLGYWPRLEACALCGETGGELRYDAAHGLAHCRTCCPGAGGRVLTAGTRTLLQNLSGKGPDWVQRIRLDGQLLREISAFLDEALVYQLGTPLKSDGFCRAVEALPRSTSAIISSKGPAFQA
jgi:DNA repair protein RecO (recombination protein O)